LNIRWISSDADRKNGSKARFNREKERESSRANSHRVDAYMSMLTLGPDVGILHILLSPDLWDSIFNMIVS